MNHIKILLYYKKWFVWFVRLYEKVAYAGALTGPLIQKICIHFLKYYEDLAL